MTVCVLGLAFGLGAAVEVLAVVLPLDTVDVVLTLTVVGLGLGPEFEDEVHPATINGAATTITITKSRYFFTL